MNKNTYLDKIKIQVRSGKGGDGCTSFRREKYIPKGGPDGGDGGQGGSVYCIGWKHKQTFYHLKARTHYIAKKGAMGQGQKKHGQKGQDLYIPVPLGTMVYDAETNYLIGKVMHHKQVLLLAKGGRGGRGNVHFKTATQRVPRFHEKGGPLEEKWLILELETLADVGFVGFPNAGKSTLLNSMTNSHTEVASYPFSTLFPHLGTISFKNWTTATLADIPGIIQDAHLGKGLGLEFLQHIKRCSILLFLIDMEAGNALMQYQILLDEINQYDPTMSQKKKCILLNKIDTLEDRKILAETQAQFIQEYKILPEDIFPISGKSREGLETFRNQLEKYISEIRLAKQAEDEQAQGHILPDQADIIQSLEQDWADDFFDADFEEDFDSNFNDTTFTDDSEESEEDFWDEEE